MAEEILKSEQATTDARPTTPPDAGQTAPPSGQQATGATAKAGAGVFEIAVLPLQNTTLFPGTAVPLAAGRPRSVAAVEAALSTPEKLVACVTVREGRAVEAEATPPDDLYSVGTLVMVKRMMRAPDALQIIVQGTER
ncbi:MAG TPA: LON peptidase substrate-binding domain-containing protein, partial [Pyrinomonadaceae bacterium]|nr:LON peptidase substrate-binding domain-containing protein [Pyrinomonadaceae bacterium]